MSVGFYFLFTIQLLKTSSESEIGMYLATLHGWFVDTLKSFSEMLIIVRRKIWRLEPDRYYRPILGIFQIIGIGSYNG